MEIQAITLQANQGEVTLTDWIPVSAFQRLRLIVPQQIGGEYIFRIDQSTADETQDAESQYTPVTPSVDYGNQYACGNNFTDGYIPQSPIFDVQEHLGANLIKVAYENISTHLDPITVFLLKSTT